MPTAALAPSDGFVGNWSAGVVGTGPFCVTHFAPEARLELEANPGYWRPGLPRGQRLVLPLGLLGYRGQYRPATTPAPRGALLTSGDRQLTVLLQPLFHEQSHCFVRPEARGFARKFASVDVDHALLWVE